MAKRKPEDPPAGSPAWMTTFSDLMNLLLCFFVMLFSMSSIDATKYSEMAAAMSNSTFSIFNAGSTAIGEGILISNGVSQLNDLDEYISNAGRNADSETDSDNYEKYDSAEALEEALNEKNLESNEELAETVQEALVEDSLADQVSVSFTAQYVQLSMKGALLFDSGSDSLKDQAKAVLDKVGVILERYGSNSTIEIEGHTDNVPIHSARFADNEELSSARALSVFYYLTETTSLDPSDLRHAGMGDRVPVADNSTEEGRSKNRRVETVLILALLVVNIVLTSVMLVSIVGTNKKTAQLVDNITTAMNLELTVPGDEETTNVALTDTEVYNIADSMTIPLKSEAGAKQDYIMFDVSLSINKKHKDYKTYGSSDTLASYENLIKDAITATVSAHTEDECREDMEGLKEEILKSVQDLFQSDFIYKVAISGVKFG